VNQVGEEDEKKEVNEVIEVTVDSGAGKNVWPKSRKTAGEIEPLKKMIKLVAANGTRIGVHGEKTIQFVKDGRKCGMKYLITDVTKPLAAVSAMVDEGNRVVFDSEGSYVECKKTGQRIYMKRSNGTFVMELEVDTGKKEKDDQMQVGAVCKSKCCQQGFRRLV